MCTRLDFNALGGATSIIVVTIDMAEVQAHRATALVKIKSMNVSGGTAIDSPSMLRDRNRSMIDNGLTRSETPSICRNRSTALRCMIEFLKSRSRSKSWYGCPPLLNGSLENIHFVIRYLDCNDARAASSSTITPI